MISSGATLRFRSLVVLGLAVRVRVSVWGREGGREGGGGGVKEWLDMYYIINTRSDVINTLLRRH